MILVDIVITATLSSIIGGLLALSTRAGAYRELRRLVVELTLDIQNLEKKLLRETKSRAGEASADRRSLRAVDEQLLMKYSQPALNSVDGSRPKPSPAQLIGR